MKCYGRSNAFYLDYNHRQENAVECIYAKMIQMHHRAPIVNISIIDRNGPISVYDESSQSNTHQVIVTTEEQIKGTVHIRLFISRVISKKKMIRKKKLNFHGISLI